LNRRFLQIEKLKSRGLARSVECNTATWKSSNLSRNPWGARKKQNFLRELTCRYLNIILKLGQPQRVGSKGYPRRHRKTAVGTTAPLLSVRSAVLRPRCHDQKLRILPVKGRDYGDSGDPKSLTIELWWLGMLNHSFGGWNIQRF
jgi:hypothetical protein